MTKAHTEKRNSINHDIQQWLAAGNKIQEIDSSVMQRFGKIKTGQAPLVFSLKSSQLKK